MPKDLKVLNWEEALNQVGGDRDFLDEVLQDLFNESDEAVAEMEGAIEKSDFSAIEKAAHRIKGSASYLHAEVLREISFQLQTAGHTGSVGAPNPAKLLDNIKDMFADFKSALHELKHEAKSKK